jgi:hypothetical protein
MTDRDRSAIATWQRHDQGDDPGHRKGSRGRPIALRYICQDCDWAGGQVGTASAHWSSTGHRVVLAYKPKEK